MSITVKLITKKLGFLSSIQAMMFSRSPVILVHRRLLTSQTLSSHREKLSETRCSPSAYIEKVNSKDNIPNSKSKCICFDPNDKFSTADSSRQIVQNVAHNQYTCSRARELAFSKTNESEQPLRLHAKPSFGTSDDIIVKENYLLFSINHQSDQCTRLKYSSSEPSNDKSSKQNIGGRPSDEQLIIVRESLANTLPKLFVQPLDYKMYHPNVVFINNIRGTESHGILSYMKQIAILRALGHIKFAYVKFEILKITSHPEDGTVRVRWRIRGIKGYMVVWNILRHRKWRAKDQKENQDLWYDGFSTYFVGSDGRIYKHVADKMMPDDDRMVLKTKETPLAPKLAALFVGFALCAKESIFPTSRADPEESRNL